MQWWRYWQLADVVKIRIGLVVHPGLVTGFAPNGEPLITSKTLRHGVMEERLSQFLGSYPWQHEPHSGPLSRLEVVNRARRMIRQPWAPLSNCEHFLAEAQGRQPSSPQLQGAIAMGILALLLFAGKGVKAA